MYVFIFWQVARSVRLHKREKKQQPLQSALLFKILEKRQAVSMYWLVAQQETSTFTKLKFSLFT